ncbi:MAG: magnesium transporter [Pseudomonadota bacterium]
MESEVRKIDDQNPPAVPDIPVRDEAGHIALPFLAMLGAAIADRDILVLRTLTEDLHEADLGDVLEELSTAQRTALAVLLGDAFDFTVLTEIDESARLEIMEALPNDVVAKGVRELESDDAVFILEDLDQPEQEEILNQIPASDRIQLQRSLDYPEESAGRRMQSDFIAIPPFWTVGQTIDILREDNSLPEEFYQIFVVDPAFRLVGTVALDRLLRTKRPVRIQEITEEARGVVRATDDQEEAALLFERYNMLSAAVLDEGDRLVGVLTIDDIVDVIHEEAEEDIKRLGGVGDEEISDTVLTTARLRLPWLLINTGTAFAAATVIGVFEATIDKIVALAILLPIASALGGNAGTQSMTVAVRAIATRNLSRSSAPRVIGREALVGLLNGVILALCTGGIAAGWFQDPTLGLVLGAAMVMTVLLATLLGILVPLTLGKLGVDPAVASGVFVTTLTDMFGFFVFLALATVAFGLTG